MKPALLLDIDGVLCPWGCAADPPGYELVRLLDDQESLWVSPANADRLERLHRLFELIWCTAWEHDANGPLAEYHRLDPLPVIVFGTERLEGGTILLPAHYNSDTWKLPWVREWADETKRPLAWIDDDLREQAFEWAEQREVPTLLVRTTCYVGLTDEHVATLEAFAEGVKDGAALRDG